MSLILIVLTKKRIEIKIRWEIWAFLVKLVSWATEEQGTSEYFRARTSIMVPTGIYSNT